MRLRMALEPDWNWNSWKAEPSEQSIYPRKEKQNENLWNQLLGIEIGTRTVPFRKHSAEIHMNPFPVEPLIAVIRPAARAQTIGTKIATWFSPKP